MRIQLDTIDAEEIQGTVLIETVDGGMVGFSFNEEYFEVELKELSSVLEILK